MVILTDISLSYLETTEGSNLAAESNHLKDKQNLCYVFGSIPPSRVAETFNWSTFRDKVTEKEVILKRLVKIEKNCLKL